MKPLTSTPAPWANSNLGESVPVDKGVTEPRQNEELNQSFHLGAALYADDLAKKKPDPEQHLHHHHHHLHQHVHHLSTEGRHGQLDSSDPWFAEVTRVKLGSLATAHRTGSTPDLASLLTNPQLPPLPRGPWCHELHEERRLSTLTPPRRRRIVSQCAGLSLDDCPATLTSPRDLPQLEDDCPGERYNARHHHHHH